MAFTEATTGDDCAPGDIVAELHWWLTILRDADARSLTLDASLRADIEAGASDRELARMSLHLADLSTRSRRRIERVLLALIDDEMALAAEGATRRPVAPGRPALRAVDPLGAASRR